MITDGQGTLITTRSCLLNPNRNPIQSGRNNELEIEAQFSELGLRKVIWLEGDPTEAITSGHIDGYAMFAPSDVLLVEALEGNSLRYTPRGVRTTLLIVKIGDKRQREAL